MEPVDTTQEVTTITVPVSTPQEDRVFRWKRKASLLLRTFGAISIAYVISAGSMNTVFISSTPQLNPNADKAIASNFNLKTPSYDPLTDEQRMVDQPLLPIAKGVEAKSNDVYSQTVIDADQVEWVEYVLTVDGKEVKVRVPKGEQPPDQQAIETIYE